MESDSDGPREVHLPRLREDQPAARTFPPHPSGLGRPEPSGGHPLREVRPASALEPPGRAICEGRGRDQPLDAGRPGRRLCQGAGPDARADPCPVLAAKRLHADDTTVPLLAKGGTKTARLWTYLRDDRPFAGGAPPAALYYFSTDRRMEHPTRHLAGWTGILQADAYGGYNELYSAQHKPAPALSALCWSHARRKFFELADIKGTARKGKKVAEEISPLALEAVRRFDAIFDIERGINGLDVDARRRVRQELVRPLVTNLHDWLRAERARMSKHNPVAKAINYMFEEDGRWEAFTRFLDDGRICLTNNAAERALRGVALGRKAWLFAGSPRGGDRAAFMYSLIVTAKMNDIDPQAWLADVLARMPSIVVSRLPELLPWNWKAAQTAKVA